MTDAPGGDPAVAALFDCTPGGDGRGGSGSTLQPSGSAACNPQTDTLCNQPLTSTDLATLGAAFTAYLKPAPQFTDPEKAAQCAALKAEYDRLFSAGKVYRGRSDTQPGDPLTPVHVGAYDPISGTMHFEPAALDAANTRDPAAMRSLVNTALHESAHALGYTHTDPVWAGTYDLYAEAPFNLLSPGTNSCMANW